MGRTLQALGGAVLVAGLAVLLVRAGRADNSERPSESQLHSYLLRMTPPSVGAAAFKVREVNKGIFFGRSYSFPVGVPPASFMESYMDFATVKGASRKMILDHGKNKRQIFCIGAISIDVEAKPDPRGSTVDLGAYWSSAREDPRYCRSALG